MRQDAANQREASLNGKTYSRRDERRILDVLGRGLLKDFPNPERIGCPGADVLKRIASREMPLSEAEKWLDHLGSCSPCYADFRRFAEARAWPRRRTLLAVAAGILLAVAVASWALLEKRNENLTAQTAVLDLRDRSVARGPEANSGAAPIKVPRRASNWEIHLPLGSGEGYYELRVMDEREKPVLSGRGIAKHEGHDVVLHISVNLSATGSGSYELQIRKGGFEWASYALDLE